MLSRVVKICRPSFWIPLYMQLINKIPLTQLEFFSISNAWVFPQKTSAVPDPRRPQENRTCTPYRCFEVFFPASPRRAFHLNRNFSPHRTGEHNPQSQCTTAFGSVFELLPGANQSQLRLIFTVDSFWTPLLMFLPLVMIHKGCHKKIVYSSSICSCAKTLDLNDFPPKIPPWTTGEGFKQLKITRLSSLIGVLCERGDGGRWTWKIGQTPPNIYKYTSRTWKLDQIITMS